jgi:hypothetical protein
MIGRMRRALLLVASLALVACGSPGPRIQLVDLQDYPAPAMFRETAVKLRLPFVSELPPRSVDGRFSLKLEDVPLDDAMRAMARLDPQFQYARHGEAVMFWPAGKADLDASPFSKRVTLEAAGGRADVLQRLIDAAKIEGESRLSIQQNIVHRPVTLHASDVTLRDAFADVAGQAHLGFMIEPGSISVIAVPE